MGNVMDSDNLLKEKEEAWRALMSAAHESLVLIDREGRILLLNETASQRLGKSVNELIDTCIYDRFPSDVARSRKKRWDYAFETGEPVYFQDSREERSFELYCYPVLGAEGGGVSKAAIFVHDITERELAKDLLERERKTFSSILEKAPYGIFFNDERGRFILINPEAMNIIGYTIEDIPDGRTWFTKAYPDPEYRRHVIETWKKDVTRKGIDRTFSVHRNDDEIREIEFRAAKLNDGRAITMFFDVTERKKAEEKLSKSEEKYRSIFENAIMGIFQTTPDGRYLSINPAGAKMYKYASPEEMIGAVGEMGQQVYVNPSDRERLKALIESRGFAEAFEAEHYCKDGSRIWTSINARAIRDTQGETIHYESTIENITERKRLESRLIQAEKMEALGTLSGGIAHDFNNILTVLQGYSNLLKMRMDTLDPLRVYVDQILSACQNAAGLTQGLLAFSRQQPISLVALNINETIRKTEALLRRLLNEEIVLRTVYSPFELTARADPTQIAQVLFNLAANARDAMNKGGVLSIETKVSKIDDAFRRLHGFGKPGEYAVISVSDTGCGMDEEIKNKVFEPFFTTKEVGKGTGFGLSTVYGIVKQHEGYILLDSKPGQGAIFEFYLPRINGDVKRQEEPLAAAAGKKERILVAEDNEGVRCLLRDTLTEHGYEVIEAVDGEDAVEKFMRNKTVDLLIFDSVMPGKSGGEAYREINRAHPEIKVIFTSGHINDAALEKSIKEKDVAFVPKPLSPEGLLQKVREVLDQRGGPGKRQ